MTISATTSPVRPRSRKIATRVAAGAALLIVPAAAAAPAVASAAPQPHPQQQQQQQRQQQPQQQRQPQQQQQRRGPHGYIPPRGFRDLRQAPAYPGPGAPPLWWWQALHAIGLA